MLIEVTRSSYFIVRFVYGVKQVYYNDRYVYALSVLVVFWATWLRLRISSAYSDAIVNILDPASDKLHNQSLAMCYLCGRKDLYEGPSISAGFLTLGRNVQPI